MSASKGVSGTELVIAAVGGAFFGILGYYTTRWLYENVLNK